MQFTDVKERISLVWGSNDALGVQLHRVGITMWLKCFEWDNEVLITPNHTHFLIPGVQDTLLEVADLEAEAQALINQKGRKGELDNWTNYQGKTLSQSIIWGGIIRTEQHGNEFTIVGQGGYSKIRLETGEVLECFNILSYHNDWVLTEKENDLHLLHLQTRQSFQLAEQLNIEAAYLNSRDSYCLIAAGGLVMYYLKQPFELLDPTKEHPSQWKHFPLLDAEFINKIEPTAKAFEFWIKLAHPSNLEVLLNVKTGQYSILNEAEKVIHRQRRELNEGGYLSDIINQLLEISKSYSQEQHDLLILLKERMNDSYWKLMKRAKEDRESYQLVHNEIREKVQQITEELDELVSDHT